MVNPKSRKTGMHAMVQYICDLSMFKKLIGIVFIPFALMMVAHLFSQFERNALHDVAVLADIQRDLLKTRAMIENALFVRDDEVIAEVKNSIEKFKKSTQEYSHADRRNVFNQKTDSFTEAFATLTAKMNQQGLDHTSGVQGELRQAIHAAEQNIKDSGTEIWLVPMLTLRRNEKDYILRGDSKYVDKWEDNYNVFQQTIAAAGDSVDNKDEILASLSLYQEKFLAWVDLNKQIIRETNLLLESLDNIEAGIEGDDSSAHAEAATQKLLAQLVFVIALLISISFVYIAKKLVTEPILELQSAAAQVASGHYEVKIKNEAADEIGQLANAFRKMMSRTTQLLDYMDKLPNPTFVIDKEFNLEFISKSGAEILQKEQEAIVGKKCYDIFKTDDCHTENCCCSRAMKEGHTFTRENIARPHGDDMPIIYTGSPL